MSIIVKNLSYVYMEDSPFEREALKDISFEIGKGEFVGIIGHTGSGKSTLVQHFNGLLKPTHGKVIINGEDISKKNLKQIRRQVGIVFQYPEHQLFEETVYKDIAFGLINQGLDAKQIDLNVINAIKAVGLEEDILQKSPFDISGGQKRRVAIAGVLVMNPEILVLDEPTAGLDPKGRDEIFQLIRNFHKNKNIIIILVSHSMEDIAKLVDRVIVMREGTIDMDGHIKDVYSNVERLEEIGLSAPQITYLMRKLKKTIPDMDGEIYTVNQAKDEILRHLRGKQND